MVGCLAKKFVNNIIVLIVELQLKNVTVNFHAWNIVIQILYIVHSKNSFDCVHIIKKISKELHS